MNATPNTSGPEAGLSITETELFHRLGWFTYIRWAMGAAALLILLASRYVLGVRFGEPGHDTLVPAIGVVAIVLLYNAAFTLAARRVRARSSIRRGTIVRLALGQLSCDTLAVCVLVHFTGGVENVFLVMILLPLIIATWMLPQSLAYATACGAAALLNAMAWCEQTGVLPHYHVRWLGGGVSLYADPRYVLEFTGAMTLMMLATVTVVSAISKRVRRREEELEKAYVALREADEAKSFFMRKAGHETRAPLAAIYSILEAIASTSPVMDDSQRHLISRSQERMRAMMDQMDELRRYSNLRSAEFAVEFHPVRLDQLVQRIVELFRQQADRANVVLSCSVSPAEVDGDEKTLQEVVTNLVANAVQYTPAGGTVEVRVSRRGGQVALEVADSGIGISPDAKASLFREFYRSPEARRMRPNGTGLGLSICRRIVEIHHGSIDFAPREGGGTVFTVLLPVRQAE